MRNGGNASPNWNGRSPNGTTVTKNADNGCGDHHRPAGSASISTESANRGRQNNDQRQQTVTEICHAAVAGTRIEIAAAPNSVEMASARLLRITHANPRQPKEHLLRFMANPQRMV